MGMEKLDKICREPTKKAIVEKTSNIFLLSLIIGKWSYNFQFFSLVKRVFIQQEMEKYKEYDNLPH